MRNRNQACLRILLRLAAVAAFAAGVSACSTVSSVTDSINPWSGPSQPADASAYPDVPDANTDAATDNTAYPSVASVPDKPTAVSTPQERTEVSNTLASDRGRAQYSTDLLRGGTEPAAAPPPPAPPKDLAAVSPAPSADDNSADTSDDSSADTQAAAPEPAPAPTPHPAPPPKKVASVSPSVTTPMSDSEPAVPVVRAPGAIPGAQPSIPADAPLAFKPSSAPPLDSSVSQFVPPSVMARYESTQAAAANAGAPSTTTKKVKVTPVTPAKPANNGDQSSITTGGGSVFVNLNAIGKDAGVTKTASGDAVMQSAVYHAPGNTPTAVVFFPGNGRAINGAGMAQIRAAVNTFKADGGQGYIRVVGHSSSRTSNMPLAEHIAYVFKQSQEKANAVAQALVRAGVPAQNVIIEAVGDTQPVYYESMPQGEEGNRRVEIFIEG
jgi:flagellar motor protein MotB